MGVIFWAPDGLRVQFGVKAVQLRWCHLPERLWYLPLPRWSNHPWAVPDSYTACDFMNLSMQIAVLVKLRIFDRKLITQSFFCKFKSEFSTVLWQLKDLPERTRLMISHSSSEARGFRDLISAQKTIRSNNIISATLFWFGHLDVNRPHLYKVWIICEKQWCTNLSQFFLG